MTGAGRCALTDPLAEPEPPYVVTLEHDAWWAVLRAINVYQAALGEVATLPEMAGLYNERHRLAKAWSALHHPERASGAQRGQERPHG